MHTCIICTPNFEGKIVGKLVELYNVHLFYTTWYKVVY